MIYTMPDRRGFCHPRFGVLRKKTYPRKVQQGGGAEPFPGAAGQIGWQVALQKVLYPLVVQRFDFYLWQAQRFAVVPAATSEQQVIARPVLDELPPGADPGPVVGAVTGRHFVEGVAQQE